MRKNNRGYTLLFAVLVASILLGIGISILNISKKEFLIATSARDSSAAFYAADSGLECAIFADSYPQDVFNTATDNTAKLESACRINLSPTVSRVATDPTGTFSFHAKFGEAGTSCAVVTVTKSLRADGSVKTSIDSRGYNVGWKADGARANKGTCDQGSAKRVERGLTYTY